MQPSQQIRLITPMIEGETLVGVVRQDADIWAVVALDLLSSEERILFEGRDIPYVPQISGEHVIWTASQKLYVYSVEQQTVEELPEVGEAPRQAHISGGIVVWEYLPSLLSAGSDIWGYDLRNRRSFPIVSRLGVQSGPLISDRWVLYLDSTDTQAVDWDEGLYAVHLDTGEVIRLGQVYGRWAHEVSQFYALDAPWAVWSTGYWSDNPELYLYNLETRQAITIPVAPCGASTAQPDGLRIWRFQVMSLFSPAANPWGMTLSAGSFSPSLFTLPCLLMVEKGGCLGGGAFRAIRLCGC